MFEFQPEPLIVQMGKLRPREFRAERGLKADLQTFGADFPIFLLPGCPFPSLGHTVQLHVVPGNPSPLPVLQFLCRWMKGVGVDAP